MSTTSDQHLALLAQAARFDSCSLSCAPGAVKGRRLKNCPLPGGITKASIGGGRSVRLLKVLQSNVCKHDCAYCANRCGRDIRRATVSPDDLADQFMALYHARQVDGLSRIFHP